MPNKQRVEAKLREMLDRLDEAGDDVRGNLARALPQRKRIRIDLTDLQTSYWAELSRGRMSELREGEVARPDIHLKTTSEDLTSALDGQKSMLSLYLSGRIRVEAGLADLLALRKLG